MDENKKNSKMSMADKIIVGTTVAAITGLGVLSVIYKQKHYQLAIEAVVKHNEMLDNALEETIKLVGESLKQ